MPYKDKTKAKEATAERVRRYRERNAYVPIADWRAFLSRLSDLERRLSCVERLADVQVRVAMPPFKPVTDPALLISLGQATCGTCWGYDRRKMRCSKKLPEVGGCESYQKVEVDADGQAIPE